MIFFRLAAIFLLPASVLAECNPLGAPTGSVTQVAPSQVSQLRDILSSREAGDTVVLADGVYQLTGPLQISSASVTLRGNSSDSSKVVLDAAYGDVSEILNIVASNVTVAHLTVKRAVHHPIHVQPAGANITGVRIHDVRVIDPGQQAIKINANSGFFADNGSVTCSELTLTDEGRSHVVDCYTGGIDAHQVRGWTFADNTISGFWCSSGLSEHGIHVWTGSRDTVVERNQISNCARGIGFGLGLQTAGRSYSDSPCDGLQNAGHYGGTIRNNFIFANDSRLFASQDGHDVGISLEDACGVYVAHNTAWSTQAPYSSIEDRFSRAGSVSNQIVNNLLSHNLRQRDGAVPVVAGNLESAAAAHFVDAAGGNLHLASSSAAKDAGSQGTVSDDIDGQARDSAPDIGADEFGGATATPTATPEPGALNLVAVTPKTAIGTVAKVRKNGRRLERARFSLTVSLDSSAVNSQALTFAASAGTAKVSLSLRKATLEPGGSVELRAAVTAVRLQAGQNLRLQVLHAGVTRTFRIRMKLRR